MEISIGRFIYGKSYLVRHDAVEIDPIELRLDNKVFETAIDDHAGALMLWY